VCTTVWSKENDKFEETETKALDIELSEGAKLGVDADSSSKSVNSRRHQIQ
jgi:hypothetical protein